VLVVELVVGVGVEEDACELGGLCECAGARLRCVGGEQREAERQRDECVLMNR